MACARANCNIAWRWKDEVQNHSHGCELTVKRKNLRLGEKVGAQWSAQKTYGTLATCVFLLKRYERKQLVQRDGREAKNAACVQWLRGSEQRPPIWIRGSTKGSWEGLRGNAWLERTGGCEATLEQHQTLGTQTEVFTPFIQNALFHLISQSLAQE